MLFNSYAFIFAFLPATLSGAYLLARLAGASAAQLWLIAASLYFYASWNLKYLPLLAASILFNFAMGRAMLASNARPNGGAEKEWLLAGAVVVDLALLGYYKYTNFFVDTVNQIGGGHWFVAQILLPLGISFYTFQQITLLVDISTGHVERFRLRDFALFVIFFPHLIAGPIVHHSEMMPQFARANWRFDLRNFVIGLTLFAAGLFKKAVLADGIAHWVAPVYAEASLHHPVTLIYAWGAALGFTLQLYFDFSGYSEMALGLGRMLNIKLPMNFNSPLRASSMIEYWQSWHITLTRFLTAYVYSPIAITVLRYRHRRGWRRGPGPHGSIGAALSLIAMPTAVTMFLSGFWHGAGFQYIVFGLLHGAFLTINHLWRLYRPRFWPDAAAHDRVMRPVGLVLTLIAGAAAQVYFHADTVATGNTVIAGMAGLHGIALPDIVVTRLHPVAVMLGRLGVQFIAAPLPPLLWLGCWIAVLLPLALAAPNLLQLLYGYEPAITLPQPPARDHRFTLAPGFIRHMSWRPTPVWACATAVLSAGGILALNQVTAFLYWQF